MTKLGVLGGMALVAALFVVACESERKEPGKADTTSGLESAERSGELLSLDLALPRYCTVSAYSSPVEPTKFAVGDYAVSSVTVTTPSGIPLSAIVKTGPDGQPSEARFGVFFRHGPTQPTHLLTPYSPLPLKSRDAATMVFETPSDIPGDRSTLTVSAPNGPSAPVIVALEEEVHGHPGRTMTVECALADGGS